MEAEALPSSKCQGVVWAEQQASIEALRLRVEWILAWQRQRWQSTYLSALDLGWRHPHQGRPTSNLVTEGETASDLGPHLQQAHVHCRH